MNGRNETQEEIIGKVFKMAGTRYLTLEEVQDIIEHAGGKHYLTTSISACIRTLCNKDGWHRDVRLREGTERLYEYSLWEGDYIENLERSNKFFDVSPELDRLLRLRQEINSV